VSRIVVSQFVSLDGVIEDPVGIEERRVVVGAGKRCFGDPGDAVDLRLVESRAVGEAVAILTYEPVRD
jgi:hypothetical protein